MSNKVKVIPCSGIGKVHGLLAREIALKLVQDICSKEAEIECLGYIVTGDQEISDRMKRSQCITIDGCPKMCAAKSVTHLGGPIAENFRIVDILKEYRGLKPGSATLLNEAGWNVVDGAAEKIAERVKEIYREG
jgi:uncharacterized metal-binding protein